MMRARWSKRTRLKRKDDRQYVGLDLYAEDGANKITYCTRWGSRLGLDTRCQCKAGSYSRVCAMNCEGVLSLGCLGLEE